jgi:ribonuclease PH
MGNTKVICNATVEEGVPRFKKDSGEGWVTAEYNMLPRSTTTRNSRDINRLKKNSRSVEIQRLIGRSLRAVVDFKVLGERTITLDCDVIQADGGTRTASITGAYVAMRLACNKLLAEGLVEEMPLNDYLAAISVGVVEEEVLLDLCYTEDFEAAVDMNVVMTGSGEYVEVQGTAEEEPYNRATLNHLLDLAEKGIAELVLDQKKIMEK